MHLILNAAVRRLIPFTHLGVLNKFFILFMIASQCPAVIGSEELSQEVIDATKRDGMNKKVYAETQLKSSPLKNYDAFNQGCNL